ncbi:MAG TPA: 6-phosphogluconolactonase [Thermoleophilia bacterium]|nr:6-phosphogluconolactonase [Thermoleophilia bacterium]
MTIEILADGDALAGRAADLFAQAAQEAAAARGRFAVALSGGASPQSLYRLLARQQFTQKVPWRRVHLYWGDERCVPPDDPESNYGVAERLFIRHVPILRENVHRIRGEEGAGGAADAYEQELRALAARERPESELPVFDLVLLGLGADGHTASLFPHSPALEEVERLAVATEAPDGSPRVTVTFPVIGAARRVWFLVSGADKAGMVAEVLEGLRVPKAVPAQAVAPVKGSLTWLLDEAAAAELSSPLPG